MNFRERFGLLFCSVVALGITALISLAQEVGFVDLTSPARGELRRPAATGSGASGSQGGVIKLIDECRSATSTVGRLRTTLLSIDGSVFRNGDRPNFQVQIENVGSTPIEVPVSPDLAALQPADPGQKMAYNRMIIELWLAGANCSTSTGGTVTLYGDNDHPGSMLRLDPGEWVRIVGIGRITLDDDQKRLAAHDPVSQMNAQTSIYRDETLLTASASATLSKNVCFDHNQGPSVKVRINGN